MKERKFKVKVKMNDDRKVEKIQYAIPGVRSYSSPLSRAVAKKKHGDYKRPSSHKRKK